MTPPAQRPALNPAQSEALSRALYAVKDRAKTLPELIEKANFALISRPVAQDAQAMAALDDAGRQMLSSLTPHLRNAQWSKAGLEPVLTAVATQAGIGFGKLAAPLRAALAGRAVTPSVYDMMLVIGRDETMARLVDAGG